jgi:hypothetical protein
VGALAATWHKYLYIVFIKTLVGRSYIKTHFFNAQIKELKGFDLGSPTRKPRALTTRASGVVYNEKGAFFLKGGRMFEGALNRGPAPKDQPPCS